MPEWISVPHASDMLAGSMISVTAPGKRLIVYRTTAGYFATDRRCTHQGADLMTVDQQSQGFRTRCHDGTRCIGVTKRQPGRPRRGPQNVPGGLVTGVEDPDTRAHGANESLSLVMFERACLAEALLLRNLGQLA